jgi:hypothetical protein
MLLLLFAVPPASAQVTFEPTRPIQPGPPDLVPRVVANRFSIFGGQPWPGSPYDTVVFTVTVENRITVFASSPRATVTQGSDATGAAVAFTLPQRLKQDGNIIASNGFQCSVAADHHSVFCWGASIAAGNSAEIQVEAYAEYGAGCRAPVSVQAVADPYNWIAEANESNNTAISTIVVTEFC